MAGPTNLVFLVLSNQANALEYVSDVIDSSLLDFESLHCLVEIYALLRGIFDELDELLGQLY